MQKKDYVITEMKEVCPVTYPDGNTLYYKWILKCEGIPVPIPLTDEQKKVIESKNL